MMRRWKVGLALVALGGVVACAEFGTDPDRAVALEFEGIPYPAIITGDTLRDADGAATRLTARAYNGSGREILDAPVEFILLDTGATVTDGYLRATRREGFVRVVAAIDAIQSLPRRIEVTRRPDSLATASAADDTLEYVVPDAEETNVSGDLRVTVLSDDIAGGVTPNVNGWLVRWRILHDGDTLAVTDTSLVKLLDGTKHLVQDTTGTDGASSRKLRVLANVLPVPADSFIVVAEVRRHGVLVRGSPRRFVVHVRPRP